MNDLIDRQAAIEAVNRSVTREAARWSIQELPSAQPEIIQCLDCIKADLCAWRRQGAKYCSFVERRTDE